MNIENYFDLINNNDLVILYFYSDDFEELNNDINIFESENDFSVIKINYKENINLIDKLFIKSVPLFRIYKNHKLIEEIFGNYNNIINILKTHIL
tara:strand:- start:311 stop:595 length:285 start_codon:yes stop_codon:yes gene_type:complete